MKQFVNRNRVRIFCDWADDNPNMPDWKDANHFKCTLKMGKKQMTLYFSQGYGINGEPEAASVLDCLASDANCIDNAQTFVAWASELGYDPDSRKAEKIFKVCEKQAEKLKNFLGDDLYEDLLYNTENL